MGDEQKPGQPLPISGQDVQANQNLSMIDRFKMVKQGLDPGNPDHVKQYHSGQTVATYSEGGQVHPAIEALRKHRGF